MNTPATMLEKGPSRSATSLLEDFATRSDDGDLYGIAKPAEHSAYFKDGSLSDASTTAFEDDYSPSKFCSYSSEDGSSATDDLVRYQVQPATHKDSSTGVLGSFIVYLQPSQSSPFNQVLTTSQQEAHSKLGRDESWLYPVHCSLTSFFTIMTAAESDGADTAASEDDTTTGTVVTAELVRLGMINALRRFAEMLRHEGPRHIKKGFFQCTPCTAPSTADLERSDANGRLKVLKVAADNSLIVPLDLSMGNEGFTTANFKARLAKLLEEEICGAAIESAVDLYITPTRPDTRKSSTTAATNNGIRVKPGSHVTLIGQRSRSQSIGTSEVIQLAEAVEADIAESRDRFVEWDIVVQQVLEWGDLEKGRPHSFREAARLNRVAVLDLHESLA